MSEKVEVAHFCGHTDTRTFNSPPSDAFLSFSYLEACNRCQRADAEHMFKAADTPMPSDLKDWAEYAGYTIIATLSRMSIALQFAADSSDAYEDCIASFVKWLISLPPTKIAQNKRMSVSDWVGEWAKESLKGSVS